jgi:hypothetical protein
VDYLPRDLAQSEESQLAIIAASILDLENRSIEYSGRRDEVDAVLGYVGLSFLFVPFHRHRSIRLSNGEANKRIEMALMITLLPGTGKRHQAGSEPISHAPRHLLVAKG